MTAGPRTSESAPLRLIDPDGEGVYMLMRDDRWSLREVAFEFFADARRWRDLTYGIVWMRRPADGRDEWLPTRWRWWHGFLPSRWRPVAYAYLCPRTGAL